MVIVQEVWLYTVLYIHLRYHLELKWMLALNHSLNQLLFKLKVLHCFRNLWNVLQSPRASPSVVMKHSSDNVEPSIWAITYTYRISIVLLTKLSSPALLYGSHPPMISIPYNYYLYVLCSKCLKLTKQASCENNISAEVLFSLMAWFYKLVYLSTKAVR